MLIINLIVIVTFVGREYGLRSYLAVIADSTYMQTFSIVTL